MNKKKRYKAIMFDIDGTLMPSGENETPSKNVTKALYKALKFIHVGVATTRPLDEIIRLEPQLVTSGPSIITGGSQIADLKTRKILWEQIINVSDAKRVYTIIQDITKGKYRRLYINENGKDTINPTSYTPKKPFQLYVHGITDDIAEKLIQEISKISTIDVNKVPSYNGFKDDVIITHARATKLHGIVEISKILGIKPEEIIAVGDGYNDFPLLMACGLKIAMENAVPDLKAIADYIAPSVSEDGVVDIINKFVL